VARLLVVDDEPQLRRALGITLRAAGHQVDTADTGASALAAAARHPPDAVLLDLGLPDLDGLEVLRALRGWTAVPVVVLSARQGQADKVAALDAGADDYVSKPFGIEELLARLRAALRRATPADAGTPAVRVGNWVADFAARTVTAAESGGEVRLTPTEWGLLQTLVRHPGLVVGQAQLLTEVWGPGHDGEAHTLRVHLANLRRKLEDDPAAPRHLLTVPRLGYRFQP